MTSLTMHIFEGNSKFLCNSMLVNVHRILRILKNFFSDSMNRGQAFSLILPTMETITSVYHEIFFPVD